MFDPVARRGGCNRDLHHFPWHNRTHLLVGRFADRTPSKSAVLISEPYWHS